MTPDPQTLADLIHAEVTRQSSEENVRNLIAKNVDDIMRRSVDNAFRYGEMSKQIEKAIAEALKLRTPLDLPAYHEMIMTLLRQQMDAHLSALFRDRLEVEMQNILSIAPPQTKLSDIVKAMKDDEDMGERHGSHCTVIVEHSENELTTGYWKVGLDHEQPKKTYGERRRSTECEVWFAVNPGGTIYSLRFDQVDAKTQIHLGHMPKWRKMVFAAYASGAKVVDDGDGDYDTGFGDV